MIDYPFKWTPQQKLLLAKTLFYMENDKEGNFKEFIDAELMRLDRENRKDTDRYMVAQRQGACQVLADILMLMEMGSETHDILLKKGQTSVIT